MKRLLALLLALLLPGCAAAEAHGFSVSIDLDEAVFAAYAKQAMQADPQYAAYDLDALASAAAKSLNGFGLDASIQDDASTLKVHLGNGELLDMAVHTTKDAMYITSPMLSGYALWDALRTNDAADGLLPKIDWESLFSGASAAAKSWFSGIVPVTTSGVFEGDAYTGGTQCITWSLTDMDIAALVSGLMTDELRAVLMPLLQHLGLNAAQLLERFDSLNAQVADADTYLYILRVVLNDAAEFVGASLTVVEENAQVATVSFGMEGNEVKLVVGLGLNNQNYWWDFSGKQNQQENIRYLSGMSREWVADKDESYSYVSAANAPLASYLLRCSLTQAGERLLWDGSISLGNEAASEYLCSSSGSYIPETESLEYSVSLGGGSNVPLRLNVRFGPVEDIAPMDSNLKLCSMTSAADSVLYEELTEKFAASLMARLIKLLPMDLIMTINQFTLPE